MPKLGGFQDCYTGGSGLASFPGRVGGLETRLGVVWYWLKPTCSYMYKCGSIPYTTSHHACDPGRDWPV